MTANESAASASERCIPFNPRRRGAFAELAPRGAANLLRFPIPPSATLEFPMKLADIAAALGRRFEGDGDLEISGVAGMEHAGPGQLTFLANPKYAPKV